MQNQNKPSLDAQQEKRNLMMYQVKLLRSVKIDSDYFRIFVKTIIPLIKLLFSAKVSAWEKKINYLNKEYGELIERKIKAELTEAFNVLKLARALNAESINKRITFIENILNGDPETLKTIPVIPHRYIMAHDKLVLLCDEIAQTGNMDFLKWPEEKQKFAEYIYHPKHFIIKYSCNSCEYTHKDKFVFTTISERNKFFKESKLDKLCPKCNIQLDFRDQQYDFDSSVTLFYKIQSLFNCNNVKNSFAAWGLCLLAETCWGNQRDFFKHQKLSHEKLNHREENNKKLSSQYFLKALRKDSYLLGFHGLRSQMVAIQKNNPGSEYIVFSKDASRFKVIRAKNVSFFAQELFDKFLDIILDDIHGSTVKPILASNQLIPYALKLRLSNMRHLQLIIEWIKGFEEIFTLHSFSSDSSKYRPNYDFVSSLVNNSGVPAELPVEDGISVEKYLERVGIEGILYNIFITKKDRGAVMQHKDVILSQIKDLDTNGLILKIQTLNKKITSKWALR